MLNKYPYLIAIISILAILIGLVELDSHILL